MDLADEEARKNKRSLPFNIEAEQALLGGLMYQNDAVHTLPPALVAEAFYEPFHSKLFTSIVESVRDGLKADPITLMDEFYGRKAFDELGGVQYLGDLVDRAPPAANINDYAHTLVELHARRKLLHLGEYLTNKAMTITKEDGGAAGLMAEMDQALLELSRSNRKLNLVDSTSAGDEVLAWVDDRSKAVGIKTGLAPLDRQLGYLLDGDLVLVGGRPSMGKSALASSIALRIANPAWWLSVIDGQETPMDELRHMQPGEPRGVIELNGEMSVAQMTRRHIADIGHNLFGKKFPTYKAMRDKTVSVEQREMMEHAVQVFKTHPVMMLKKTGLKVSDLKSIVRRQVSTWERSGFQTGALFVDHVGLLRAEARTSGRYEAQMEIAIAMKELADELHCPVVAMIQLSREVEKRDDKRPQLSDLRDAGGWEENADTVLFPYRDSYYAQREKQPDEKELIKWQEWDKRRKSMAMEVSIAKLREGEAGQAVELWGGMAWNAIRSSEPESHGELL